MKIIEIEAKYKTSPPCPYYGRCGGCQLQHMSYEGQSLYKQTIVEGLLSSFGNVNPILGMKEPYYYRNKIHSTFSYDKKGQIISGFYQENTHNVINIDKCIIQDSKADEIIETIKGFMRSFKMKPYDEDTKQGFLRHVLIKRGFSTGQVMVVLVVASKIFPGKNNYIKALVKKHPEISTIILNINNRKTSVVLGNEEMVLHGKGYIEDILCGVKFQISAKSFYQVNPIQTEILYSKAIEMAKLKGNETVIDAYCGIGTIGLIVSSKVKDVIGVELNKDAVRDAIKNAKMNNIKNAYFYNDDAGDFMVKLAMEDKKVDLVIMDPPRTGSDEKFQSSVVKLSPEKIVYISCNPETQARDLRYLVKNGYKVGEIQPVDMFPWTEHVETVVSLSHKKADTHININVEFGDDKGQIPIDEIARKAEEYRPSERVTYKMIQEYIESKYNFKVHTAYIAEVKRDLGLPMYDAPNAVEELKHERKHPTPEKVEAIKDALRHFGVIQ